MIALYLTAGVFLTMVVLIVVGSVLEANYRNQNQVDVPPPSGRNVDDAEL